MLGVAKFQSGHYDEAIQLIGKASKLLPNNDLVYFNLGNALRAQSRLEEADSAFRVALRLRPDNRDALKNLGNVLKEQNRMAEAIACYDQILATDPEDAYTRYNKAIALLSMGLLADGWQLYEDRLQCDTTDGRRLRHELPRLAPDWSGAPLSKPLLVLPEQGLGDQIFYASMLADLQAAGIDTIACIDTRLVDLFARSFRDIEFIAESDLLSRTSSSRDYGAQICIGSLGQIFRQDSRSFASIPSPYLFANPDMTAALRSEVKRSNKLVCGLSWSSHSAHNSHAKSLSLRKLLPVLQLDGIEFINLQYGDTRAERDTLKSEAGVNIRHFDNIDNKDDIDRLASLVSACDLVLTVSNSTAHLAAAMGTPTLVLLPHHSPLWYWHLDGMHSPWYPTATLLRQSTPGDWKPTVESAAHIVKGLISSV